MDSTTPVTKTISRNRYHIAVIGLGNQGKGIAGAVKRLGHELVGAADVGALVGRPLSTVVPDYNGPLRVSGSIDALLKQGARPDIAVISAAVDLATTLDMAGTLLDRGINVITLNPEGFAPDPSWAEATHARALAGGATMLNTGIQDLWMVQLLTLVAASSIEIRKLILTEEVSLEVLSPAIGKKIGISLSPDDFAAHVAATADRPSVIGGPLIEAARRIGAKAGPTTKTITALYTGVPYVWRSADITLPPERTQGFEERITFETDQGFLVEGVIAVVPKGEDALVNTIRVEGTPDHALSFGSLAKEATDAILIARIPDVVEASPGLLFAADLREPRHHLKIPVNCG